MQLWRETAHLPRTCSWSSLMASRLTLLAPFLALTASALRSGAWDFLPRPLPTGFLGQPRGNAHRRTVHDETDGRGLNRAARDLGESAPAPRASGPRGDNPRPPSDRPGTGRPGTRMGSSPLEADEYSETVCLPIRSRLDAQMDRPISTWTMGTRNSENLCPTNFVWASRTGVKNKG